MTYKRLSGLLTMAGLAFLLSGCVVAPIGARPYGAYYGASPVYAQPAPVVVAPAPGYYGGYYGYRGFRGHRGWR
jgi:hypothetical protein